jgi:uncharacterized protein (DUF1778 family)
MSKKAVLSRVETRTVTVAIKVTERMSKAIDRAAADNDRRRSSFIADVMQIWLKENGYLK